jgi:uncharacterized protein (DUF1684 family)
MTRDLPDELSLADWRRRVAGLYVEVRRLYGSDPDAALAFWRTEREALYRDHPQSPVPATARPAFRSLHFPADPALRFEVAVEPEPPAATAATAPPAAPNETAAAQFGFAAPLLQLPMSGGGQMGFRRIGFVTVPFAAGARRLGLFWMEGYAGGLFLPFRDATNGTETYGAGRYLLDAAKSADLGGDVARGRLRLDFNFAYQPSCAFDPRWACPLAPPENWLDIPIRAGERIA